KRTKPDDRPRGTAPGTPAGATPTAGHSQPHTGSSGKSATNRPRHSSCSPVALTAAAAITTGSALRSSGASSVPAAPNCGTSRAATLSHRGLGQRTGGVARQRADPVPAEQTERDEVAGRPVDGEAGEVAAAGPQPP